MLGSHRRGVKGKCLAVCCRGGIFLAIIDSQGNGKGLLHMYEYKHCFEDSAVHSKVPALCPLRNHKYVRVKTADRQEVPGSLKAEGVVVPSFLCLFWK